MREALPHNEFIAQLRGVAVLVVVLMHYALCFPISYIRFDFVANGYYGVSLFFVISGFLITGNFLARFGKLATINVADFYVMRGARILPCLAFLLVILSAISRSTNIGGFVFKPPLSVTGAVESVLTLRFNRYYVEGAFNTLAWAVLWSISDRKSVV